MAHTPPPFRKLAKECSAPSNPVFDTGAFVVPRENQQSELGTSAYFGGVVYPKHASIDPARYHSGLIAVAENAGVEIISRCSAGNVARANGKIRGRNF